MVESTEYLRTTLNNNDKILFNTHRAEVEKVLPEWFREENAQLILMLKAYYQWLYKNGVVDYTNLRNVELVSEDFLKLLEDELLAGEGYFDGFDNLRTALKMSSLFFKSKGTDESIRLFFKGFYNADVQISYPKTQLLVLENSIPAEEEYSVFDTITMGVIALDLLAAAVGATSQSIFYTDVWNQTSPNGFKYGDITNNGSIGAQDALKLVQYAAGVSIEYNPSIKHITEQILTNPIIKEYFKNNTVSTGTKLGEGRTPDGGKYQINSIELATNLDPEIWLETYKLLVHPAGVYLSIASLGEDVSIIEGPQLYPVGEIEDYRLQPTLVPTFDLYA